MAKKDTQPTQGRADDIRPRKEAVEMEQTRRARGAGGEKELERNASGFYCYIGPNLKGLIQTGTIYRGTRADALARAEKAIATRPLVKTLIVSGDALPGARVKAKTPGNALYANYMKLEKGDPAGT